MVELDIVEPEMMIIVWIFFPRTRHSSLSPASIRFICSLHTNRKPPFSTGTPFTFTEGMWYVKCQVGGPEESLPPCTRQAEPVRHWASIRGKVLALMPWHMCCLVAVDQNMWISPPKTGGLPGLPPRNGRVST